MKITIEQVQADNTLENAFVKQNIGLVKKAISKLGINYADEDIFQEGCVGLIKAMRRYDPAHGVLFSTYAVPWITGMVRQHMRDYGYASMTGLHLPRDIMDMYGKLKKYEDSETADTEICLELGISQDRLSEAKQALSHRTCNLDREINAGNSGDRKMKMYELIPAAVDVEKEVVNRVSTDELFEKLSECLSKRDFYVLKLRLKDMSQEEIGEAIKMSQAHVSRILRDIYYTAKQILTAEGEMLDEKPRTITDEELLEECLAYGTKEEGRRVIAEKYGMKETTIHNKIYRSRINKLIKQKRAEKEAV